MKPRRAALAVGLGVLLLEALLRVALGGAFPPRFFEPHPQLGHFHRAGASGWQRTAEYETFVQINAQGLRDDPLPYAKPQGAFRILLLGDSFVEGLQVGQHETFAALLEKRLGVTVINAGVSRYGTAHSLLYLRHEGQRYQPDLVVYALYPNDITDNLESGLFGWQGGRLVQRPMRVSAWEKVRAFLYDYSFVYRAGLVVSIIAQQRRDPTLISTEAGLVLPIYRAELHPREEEAWALTTALLQAMQAAAGEAPLVVVYLPEALQTRDDLWAKVARTPGETLRRDAPNQRLAASLPPGVGWVDLSAGFRQAQSANLYYTVDGHFTPAGHALAADLLAPALRPYP